MGRYKVTTEDGKSYAVTTEDEKPSLLSKGLASYASMMGPEGGYGSNPAGKLMSLVKKPFNKAGEAIATSPFGQKNPNVGAALGTAVQMAPDIATTLGPGVPKEVPNAPGELTQGIMGQAESSSGSMKGSLESAYKDSSLIFSKGQKAAKPLYEAAKAELPYEQTIFKGLTDHADIKDKAIQTLEKGGKLEPQEAFIARKSLDKVKKTMNPDAFDYYRKVLDGLAKSDTNIAKADPLNVRGLKASSLRNLMPQNKLGGASAFKMALVPAMSGVGAALGGHTGAAIGAAAGSAALSPIIQGVTTTAAGIGAKLLKDPQLMTAVLDFLNKNRGQQGGQ